MQTQKILEIIHSDICQTHTFIDCIYLLTFINEFFFNIKKLFVKT
jgi:hypothetical protein